MTQREQNEETGEEKTIIHQPVMVDAVLAGLDCKPGTDKLYVDCTLGLGGHAEAILTETAPKGKLIGIDRDAGALEQAKARLKPLSDRLHLEKGSFRELIHIMKKLNYEEANGFLFDFGVSSYQLDRPERGFSFQKPGPLDMRMDVESGPTAADLVNRLSQKELKDIIQKFGEERWATPISRGIIQHRSEQGRILRTEELEQIVWRAVPSRFRHGRIHPATRTFQALRMVVNDEMAQIEAGMAAAISLLALGGRLVVISFHSIEDRAVKQCFKRWSQKKEAPSSKRFINLFKKPQRAEPSEIAQNRRARSAKLRVLERAA